MFTGHQSLFLFSTSAPGCPSETEGQTRQGDTQGRHTAPLRRIWCAGHDVGVRMYCRKSVGDNAGDGALGNHQVVAVIDAAAVDNLDFERAGPLGCPGADAVVNVVVVLGNEVVVFVVDIEVQVGVAVALYGDAGFAVGAEGIGPGVGVASQHLVVEVDARTNLVVRVGGHRDAGGSGGGGGFAVGGVCGAEGKEGEGAGGKEALGHHSGMPWSVSGATFNGYCFVLCLFMCPTRQK